MRLQCGFVEKCAPLRYAHSPVSRRLAVSRQQALYDYMIGAICCLCTYCYKTFTATVSQSKHSLALAVSVWHHEEVVVGICQTFKMLSYAEFLMNCIFVFFNYHEEPMVEFCKTFKMLTSLNFIRTLNSLKTTG